MRAYLDWNATTPLHPDVIAAMNDANANAWGNASSIHAEGRAARAVLEDARQAVADLAGTDARDVLITSGGTEANNIAVRSVFPLGGERRVLVTSRIEHPSIVRVAEALEREGRATVRFVNVRPDGAIDCEDLERTVKDDTALITVQAANHETGVVQPVADVIAIAKRVGARVHVDAVQGWGKIDVPSGWHSASLAVHKMRGPKGIGALITRPAVKLEPVLLGGTQEKGLRPGTPAAPLAAGLAAAVRLASPSRCASLAKRRDALEGALLALGRAKVAGDPTRRAPHVSMLLWRGWIGAELIAALDLEGVSVSAGAACSAGTVEPSPVLKAMLGDGPDALSGVRTSIGETTTDEEIAFAVEAFRRVVARAK
jgi:cysteine desulfurase